jgi:hypothetical protein
MTDTKFIPSIAFDQGCSICPKIYPFEIILGKGFNNDYFSSDSR